MIIYTTQSCQNVIRTQLDTYLVTVVKSTNQMQAFHEPPSLRPHCSSSQQWVTPEMGLCSTSRQGIQAQCRNLHSDTNLQCTFFQTKAYNAQYNNRYTLTFDLHITYSPVYIYTPHAFKQLNTLNTEYSYELLP